MQHSAGQRPAALCFAPAICLGFRSIMWICATRRPVVPCVNLHAAGHLNSLPLTRQPADPFAANATRSSRRSSAHRYALHHRTALLSTPHVFAPVTHVAVCRFSIDASLRIVPPLVALRCVASPRFAPQSSSQPRASHLPFHLLFALAAYPFPVWRLNRRRVAPPCSAPRRYVPQLTTALPLPAALLTAPAI